MNGLYEFSSHIFDALCGQSYLEEDDDSAEQIVEGAIYEILTHDGNAFSVDACAVDAFE